MPAGSSQGCSSPYRPYPGRLHLASGLTLVFIAGEVAGVSHAVLGFLMIAAGAAFMHRVAEAFIGRKAFRAEILMLSGASALAGTGVMMAGAARLGAPWGEVTGLHIAFMGGLGLGVYAVFCIAGSLHTNRPLGLAWPARWGAAAIVTAVALRVAPQFGVLPPLPFSVSPYAAASLAWAAAYIAWLWAYAPFMARLTESAITTAGIVPRASVSPDMTPEPLPSDEDRDARGVRVNQVA